MMPRLMKLISDRRAKSRSYSNPPFEQVTDESPSGQKLSSPETPRQLTRDYTRGSSIGTSRAGDVELAMWSSAHPQSVGESVA